MPLIPDSRILIVATDGFEEWELFGPREILQKRGAEVVLASLKTDPIQATVHDDPGKTIRPDLTIDEARADDFDALILPGGVRNPDTLRVHGNVIDLICDFDRQVGPNGFAGVVVDRSLDRVALRRSEDHFRAAVLKDLSGPEQLPFLKSVGRDDQHS